MACCTSAERRAVGLALLGWLGLSSCETPGLAPPAQSVDRYERCASPAGVEALRQGRALLARGDYAGALPHLEAVLDACPEHVRTHLAYVDAAERVGGAALQEAVSRYAEAGDDGTSPVPVYLRARLSAEDEYTREQLLQGALQRDPSFYWAYLSLARLHRGGKRTAAALTALQNALSAEPDFAEARLELGQVLEELGRYEEAELEYANYLRARPTDREVQRDYVALLIYKLRRPDQAFEIARRNLDDDPADIEALMNMAAIHWLGSRPEEAAQFYRQVLSLDPTQSRAVLNLGNYYYDHYDRIGGSDEASKKAAWSKARAAYRYYLGMQRTDGVFDAGDYHFGVPYRLKQIEALLGEAPAAAPTLDDF